MEEKSVFLTAKRKMEENGALLQLSIATLGSNFDGESSSSLALYIRCVCACSAPKSHDVDDITSIPKEEREELLCC